jgi:predicted metal-dependent peptidase
MTKIEKDICENISIARSLLLKKQPFFGPLVFLMKQELTSDPRLATCATNGKTIFYNPDFISKLKIKEVSFVIAHELLHCIFDHLKREKGRDHTLWNYACDYVVNYLLDKHKVGTKPQGVLFDTKYRNYSAEEVYEDLKQMSPEQLQNQIGKNGTLDDHDFNLYPLSDEEKEEVKERLKEVLTQGLKSAGDSSLGQELQNILTEESNQVNWKDVLKESLTSPVFADQTFMKPNRRAAVLNVILPSSKKEETIDICIAIDSSGSVCKKMLEVFLAEIYSIVHTYSSFKLRVWSFDTKCYNYQEFTEDNLEELYDYRIVGGGGTLFECNWEMLQEKGVQPNQLLIYTDGYPCRTWGDANYCPVIFCICDARDIIPPFGEYVYVQS